MSRALRPRSSIDYSSESRNDSVFTVESASKWKEDTTRYMKIKVVDVHEMFPPADLPNEAKLLVIPEWVDGEWLKSLNIKTSQYGNKVKTLIGKIRKVFLSGEESITEVIVDGFMESLLHTTCDRGQDRNECIIFEQLERRPSHGRTFCSCALCSNQVPFENYVSGNSTCCQGHWHKVYIL